MARIRTIKPEFWADEKLARMDAPTRLLFLALISMADDCGRLVDSVPQIASFVHPFYDEANDPETEFANVSREIRESLAKLTVSGRVARGSNSHGQKVIQIVNWKRHQRVDHPNLKSALAQIIGLKEVNAPLAKRSRKPREKFPSNSRTIPVPVPVPVPSSPDADAPATRDVGRDTWLTPYLELWTRQVGVVTPARLGKALSPVHHKYGPGDTLAGLQAYLDEPRPPDKPVKLEWFASDAARWIAEGRTPLQNPDGTLTARGERITRPDT